MAESQTRETVEHNINDAYYSAFAGLAHGENKAWAVLTCSCGYQSSPQPTWAGAGSMMDDHLERYANA